MFRNNYWASLQLILILLIILNVSALFDSGRAVQLVEVQTENEPLKVPGYNKFEHKPVDELNKQYDTHFRKATKKYFGLGLDWRWTKAQSMAESGLNPKAQSPVGAKGLMQLMDPTYAEVKQKNSAVLGNVFEARWNIEAGVYYDSKLYAQWSSPRPDADRLALTFASYNAGLGNILKAQRICADINDELNEEHDVPNCNLWEYIQLVGNIVNSWKEEETIGYVDRIFGFMNEDI